MRNRKERTPGAPERIGNRPVAVKNRAAPVTLATEPFGQDAGAVAVMALERVPADIRAEGGVARMAAPTKVKEIMAAVTIPVMAKCRIGHFGEAQVLEALGVDFVDESEVLTPWASNS